MAGQLRESAQDGEPRRVTLRELSRAELVVAPSTVVFVCENPAVVEAAADALGSRCPWLVCVEGVCPDGGPSGVCGTGVGAGSGEALPQEPARRVLSA